MHAIGDVLLAISLVGSPVTATNAQQPVQLKMEHDRPGDDRPAKGHGGASGS